MIAFLDIDFSSLVSGLVSGIGNVFKSAFSWLIDQAWAFLQWVWSYVPHELPWPSGAPSPADGITFILSYVNKPLGAANYYSPVDLMVVLLVLALAQESILAIFHGVRWLIAHLPFIGGEV